MCMVPEMKTLSPFSDHFCDFLPRRTTVEEDALKAWKVGLARDTFLTNAVDITFNGEEKVIHYRDSLKTFFVVVRKLGKRD